MRIATLQFCKRISWLIGSSDPPLAALKYLPGWSVIHPSIQGPRDSGNADDETSIGDRRWIVNRKELRCVVPDTDLSSDAAPESNAERLWEQITALMIRLKYVSRQSLMARGDDIISLQYDDVKELPHPQFPESMSCGGVIDRAYLAEALSMEQVIKAGELSIHFSLLVYEGLLLDAIRATRESDFRAAILYSALSIEALAGTRLDEEMQQLLATKPLPLQIRAAEIQDGKSKGDIEDPVYKQLRKTGRFSSLLHEIPLYVLRKSLKIEASNTYKRAQWLYETRNSIAHRGETGKDNNLLPVDRQGAKTAVQCAAEVFAWFGISGKWPIPSGFCRLPISADRTSV